MRLVASIDDRVLTEHQTLRRKSDILRQSLMKSHKRVAEEESKLGTPKLCNIGSARTDAHIRAWNRLCENYPGIPEYVQSKDQISAGPTLAKAYALPKPNKDYSLLLALPSIYSPPPSKETLASGLSEGSRTSHLSLDIKDRLDIELKEQTELLRKQVEKLAMDEVSLSPAFDSKDGHAILTASTLGPLSTTKKTLTHRDKLARRILVLKHEIPARAREVGAMGQVIAVLCEDLRDLEESIAWLETQRAEMANFKSKRKAVLEASARIQVLESARASAKKKLKESRSEVYLANLERKRVESLLTTTKKELDQERERIAFQNSIADMSLKELQRSRSPNPSTHERPSSSATFPSSKALPVTEC
eukprot:CAMPEP_0172624748 /NCGR_PEP_ID=MMETSP1068-20121228/139013_1 /TAXON_ID=35684 /ORGANISM="Pseudopedinella elastica, Strain CCMP716" /LENGTH=361 /DNA_ID=CAMNT_0013433809 /DNA_START=205 /DNA_END=1290 /DNA_ORIENTATION=-